MLAGEGRPKAAITNLASKRVTTTVTLAVDSAPSSIHFSPDSRALVYPADGKDGWTLIYQPIDGAPSHQLVNPVIPVLNDFAWSPSGKELAVTRLRQTSDAVLISDGSGKAKD